MVKTDYHIELEVLNFANLRKSEQETTKEDSLCGLLSPRPVVLQRWWQGTCRHSKGRGRRPHIVNYKHLWSQTGNGVSSVWCLGQDHRTTWKKTHTQRGKKLVTYFFHSWNFHLHMHDNTFLKELYESNSIMLTSCLPNALPFNLM